MGADGEYPPNGADDPDDQEGLQLQAAPLEVSDAVRMTSITMLRDAM
jgi:hypothetical protein